jgi:predicted flap endonuclease-1-like 5' DNA nuclease
LAKLSEIEGIGAGFAQKLKDVGIDTVGELLAMGAGAKDRADLAQATGISPRLILEWVNLADLSRINGIGDQYADLLEAAGVDSVTELATRNAESLHLKLTEINQEKRLVRQVPGIAQVTTWVEEAKKLPRVVTH